MILELFGLALGVSASVGAVAGGFIARAKTRKMRVIAESMPAVDSPVDSAHAREDAGPFRLPAPLPSVASTAGRKRRGRLVGHDADLMIGRTFFH